MNEQAPSIPAPALEKLSGIVKRVTFHSPESGWSVLKINTFDRPQDEIPVTVHQSKVFAGATMDFFGVWVNHPTYGRQFKARRVEERKPATAHALEKYLGSGLIKGVGPKTARKIVKYFGKETLDVFEHDIDRLTEVPGIAKRKLDSIQTAWTEHQEIREVMMFLQSHNISTLFAVKIYKVYGHQAIAIVQQNPYRLAQDIYGIGFLSADKVALSLGLAKDSSARVQAGISHILHNAREEGHCYLTQEQIIEQTLVLLDLADEQRIVDELHTMENEDELKTRNIPAEDGTHTAYYAHSLFFDEDYLAKKCLLLADAEVKVNQEYVHQWIIQYCSQHDIQLSFEQLESVQQVIGRRLTILTGGPGCGKTTTTKVIAALLQSLRKEVLLAAPTGRAAQRMSEVIGQEAKTIHRLLEWEPMRGGFKRNEENPLECDFLIVDESSMLDVHLAASLFRAVPTHAQLLLIGDADQLPSVGAGNVFKDLIHSEKIVCARLTKVFRQAAQSKIIQYAHQINQGQIPKVATPFQYPKLWKEREDCLFIDSEEATQEQLHFIQKVKRMAERNVNQSLQVAEPEEAYEMYRENLVIPDKFAHVDIDKLLSANTHTHELMEVLRRVNPWSSLHWGFSAVDMVERLYRVIIPKYFGKEAEIQILSPMSKGSLGTHHLNELIQETINPEWEGKAQIDFGGRIFRVGDRVIQRKNNYDLNVFNGDIGKIADINTEEMSCIVKFSAGKEEKEVVYEKAQLPELDLAYAITIHKSQGSEFEVVILPLVTQHYNMLFRNLIYTGLTRARKLAIFVGSRRALRRAVTQQNSAQRQTALQWLIQAEVL
ncbi:SF1B family DNA helicase RecD2 [Catalinimonas niigatensis]|uniref:SF1B family DNA helicase RecD2 n=1 Tax=Catalinimonas niigatensis TaxID=1397264 RepID=UPI00266581CA|nr:AAA family ATPase [Catalinimonas niigatensis]WPP51194.1 AAA family ATPase [Catalinimonas niigatensis]